MNLSEKFCLKWNDFKENINSKFGSLREDTDFTDVTLVCQDGQQVEAHKVILVTSSPFFHNMLKKNKHPHPLIYMRGVKSEELLAMVDFLYHGQANIYQENLDAFLVLADELKLKGLNGESEEILQKEDPEQTAYDMTNIKTESKERHQNLPKYFAKASILTEENCDYPIENVGQSEYLPHQKITVELQELDNKIKSMMTSTDELVKTRRINICNVCGKKGFWTNIKDHIEANHIEGISHSCTYCEKTFRSRPALRMHKSSQHKV